MPIRSDLEQYRTKENLELDSKSAANSASRPSGLDGHGDEEGQIIECRKKNRSGELEVTHRFRKGKLLGKGGFAHCYKVTCMESDKAYAMKIVPKSTLTRTRARQKLQTEIKIHRTLQHPRIVRFELFFEDRENVYILLELCTNHVSGQGLIPTLNQGAEVVDYARFTLSELIRKARRFTEDEARTYMIQILDATSYLHRHQIIHRDLKLGNVFLDKDWNVKMGDFGLATKLVQDSERKRTICGTPNYIAPEILEGTTGHSYQVDLWSTGVILYTMLVGRPPYESKDVKSTYRRILANVYAFPESVPVSDSAKDLVRRLLQVKPELRPSLHEILNHPFLRNGGPLQRFSTAHGLRSSTSTPSIMTKSPPSAATSTTGSRAVVTQKHDIPDRCVGAAAAAGGGGGLRRPPLTTRVSNVDAPGEFQHQAEKLWLGKQSRAGAGSAGASEDGARPGTPKDSLGRHGARGSSNGGARKTSASSRAATKSASSSSSGERNSPITRAAVPRTGSTRGFSVYCDVKQSSSAGSAISSRILGSDGSRNSVPQGVERAPARRGEAVGARGNGKGSGAGNGKVTGSEIRSPGDKENDTYHLAYRPLGGSIGGDSVGGGGARAGMNRPLLRSASSGVGLGTDARTGQGRSRSGSSSVVGSSAGTVVGSGAGTVVGRANAGGGGGGVRAVGLRRSATTAGTKAEQEASSSRAIGAAGRAYPHLRSSSREVTSRGSFRSPATAAPGASSNIDGAGVTAARAEAGAGEGAGTAATQRGANKGGARQRLDVGGTPKSVGGQRASTESARDAVGGKKREALDRAKGMGASSASVTAEKPGSSLPGVVASADGRATADHERDTLEIMHDRLMSSFGPGDKNARAPSSEIPRAEEVDVNVDEEETPTPPTVWVTRYIDYSSKYGLGFLLSDGSAGVYFNDATKIVLEPDGVSFDYIERSRRSQSQPALLAGGKREESAGLSRVSVGQQQQPPRSRYSLDKFLPELKKKVTLLNHFRGYLHELVKKEGGSVAVEAVTSMASPRRETGEPLVFLKKWLRTRSAILFRLSDGTVQFVFSDQTEILLSKDAGVVTFVDARGERETYTLERVLKEQRSDVTKRVRYSKELIAQLLRRA